MKIYKITWGIFNDAIGGGFAMVSNQPTPCLFSKEKLFSKKEDAEAFYHDLEGAALLLGIGMMCRIKLEDQDID